MKAPVTSRRLIATGCLALVLSSCAAGRATAPDSSQATTGARASTTTVEAPTTTTTPTASAPSPPYALSELTLRLVDRSRPTVAAGRTISATRALTTLVWMPVGAGRWPLIVFAHGFDVSPAPYAALLGSWAAHGYVVAAPEFPLTDPDVAGSNLDEVDIDNEVADLRFVTDYLVSPDSPLLDRIDPNRVAVAGHSDGAEAAIAAAAASVPAGEPRYLALLALAAQPVEGTAGQNPPILVAQGDADTTNPPSYGLQTWQQAAPPKYLLEIKGGGHLPPFEAGSVWLPGIESITETFLDSYLAGDAGTASITTTAGRYNGLYLRTG